MNYALNKMNYALNKMNYALNKMNYALNKMRWQINKILLFFLSFLCCSVCNAGVIAEGQDIRMISTLDKGIITIGDKVRYSITVEASDNFDFELADFAENLGVFAIKDFGRNDLAAGKKEYWYLLDTYVTGPYVIPPAKLKFWAKDKPADIEYLAASSLFIEVKSMLAGEKLENIRDIKNPVTIFVSYKKYYIFASVIIVTIVLIVFGIFLFLKFRKKKEIREQAYVRPAHEIAYEALDDILKQELIKQQKFKEYYYLISNVIRQYIEQRFEIMALELTTEEFLSCLSKQKDLLDARFKKILKEFLNICDMVKFAKYGPTLKEAEDVYLIARNFIDETKLAASVDEEDEDEE